MTIAEVLMPPRKHEIAAPAVRRAIKEIARSLGLTEGSVKNICTSLSQGSDYENI
jgi:hypothetical protein